MYHNKRDEYGHFIPAGRRPTAESVARRNRRKKNGGGNYISKLTRGYEGDIAPEQVDRLKTAKSSFAVRFVRKTDLNDDGSIKADEKPSTRRFVTAAEAEQHGKRFAKKWGHKSFFIVPSKDRPNAWINWDTGLTNPVIAR